MADVRYFAPVTIGEGIACLQNNPQATLFAGGTDLLVGMNHRRFYPETIIDLKNIPELNYLRFSDNRLRIGAMTVIQSVAENSEIRERYPFLADAASCLGSWQIRNVATVGGNLCNAAPSAELATPLLVLNASATLIGPDGERTISLNRFFTGPGKTILKKNEILKEISFPVPEENFRGVYLRHQLRRSMDIAVVNLTIGLELDGKMVKGSRIFLGAVAPVPMRAEGTEDFLAGRELSEETIRLAAEKASEEAKPISDVRASSGYRRQLVKVLVKKALVLLTERGVAEG